VLIPPRLLPPAAAAELRANCAYVVECDRVWSLKQVGAISGPEVERLFARAAYARGQAALMARIGGGHG
jgi:hypothetical protein